MPLPPPLLSTGFTPQQHDLKLIKSSNKLPDVFSCVIKLLVGKCKAGIGNVDFVVCSVGLGQLIPHASQIRLDEEGKQAVGIRCRNRGGDNANDSSASLLTVFPFYSIASFSVSLRICTAPAVARAKRHHVENVA